MEKERKYYTEDLIKGAIEELQERIKEDNLNLNSIYNELDDAIAEIADNNVPIYTYDLLQYASNNFDLIYPNELCNEESTVTGIIMANIYELLHTELYAYVNTIQDKQKETEKE